MNSKTLSKLYRFNLYDDVRKTVDGPKVRDYGDRRTDCVYVNFSSGTCETHFSPSDFYSSSKIVRFMIYEGSLEIRNQS